MLDTNMQTLIKLEIANDPAGRGYANMTAQQQADLLNANYTLPGPVITMKPRVSQLFNGLAGAPNAVDSDDVTSALASSAQTV